MKRAIVTGATGMIASALIRTLIANGVEVYALCKPGDRRDAELFSSPLVTAVEADISALPIAARSIGKPCDVLYHFAWLGTFGGGRDDAYLQSDNIKYSIDAVRLANMTGCECFVGAGSQAEYGRVTEKLTPLTPANPETGYAIAKYTSGKLTRLYAQKLGIRHVWTRILSVYGIGANPDTLFPASIRRLLSGEHASFTAGEQLWDFLYCDDCAEAFYRLGLSGKNGMTYPIASGETRRLKDFILAMRDAVNPEIKIGIGELPYNPGQVMCLSADISALTHDTGFVPKISFEDGIRRVIDSLR